MSKVNTQAVKDRVVEMISELRDVMKIYFNDREQVAKVEANTIWTREYKDAEIKAIRERTLSTVREHFDTLYQKQELLKASLEENDNTYDFSDPEFASCITLITASPRPLPAETIIGITDKFMGNRQALLALAEVAKETNEVSLRERVFNTHTEMENLLSDIESLDYGFPESILHLPGLRDYLVRIAKACGQNISDEEKELGAGYQDLVTMQIRAAMGLSE